MVVLDCPPGLSFAALAALDLADHVIVPFRPDFVSQFALDRVARQLAEQFVAQRREAARDRRVQRYQAELQTARDAEETLRVRVEQLRQDTQCYAPRLQVRAASCWHAWLHEVIDHGGEVRIATQAAR